MSVQRLLSKFRSQPKDVIAEYRTHYVVRNLSKGINRLLSKRLTRWPVIYLTILVILAIIGPYITPYPYDQSLYTSSGELLRVESPSLAHPLGTTNHGYDVLSRIIYGVRPTVITGFFGGSIIITIGTTIGLTAGYVGGRVENILMRLTDFVYGLPLLPFAIVLLALLGIGFFSSIAVIGLILWRSSARVLRAQVLQIKNRPYITASRAAGASTTRVIVKHILPNVMPMAALFFAFGIGYSILVQASLAFLGVTNPFIPSWGVMIRNAYGSGYMGRQLAWALTPGFLIAMTVLSAFLIGREFEQAEEAGDVIIGEG